MKLTEEQIKEIAEQINSGMNCYVHRLTGNIISVIDLDNFDADEEGWEKELKEIEDNSDNYLKIENMSSTEKFELMAEFAKNLNNPLLKEELIKALEKAKPFRNFKWLIDNSGLYRQKWFDFENQKMIDWVKQQLTDTFDQTINLSE